MKNLHKRILLLTCWSLFLLVSQLVFAKNETFRITINLLNNSSEDLKIEATNIKNIEESPPPTETHNSKTLEKFKGKAQVILEGYINKTSLITSRILLANANYPFSDIPVTITRHSFRIISDTNNFDSWFQDRGNSNPNSGIMVRVTRWVVTRSSNNKLFLEINLIIEGVTFGNQPIRCIIPG